MFKRLHIVIYVTVIFTCAGFIPAIKNTFVFANKPLHIANTSLTKTEKFKLNHPKREFRSAWVTTFTNLDWPSKRGLKVDELKTEFITILNSFKKSGINAVIAQVRASGDAFYKSKHAPWSEWLTGVQGVAPENGFDPLEFMIDECHKRNMEFHAWLNPFRAVSHTKFSSVASSNLVNKKPEWFFTYGNSKYFNPGVPQAREHIVALVDEIINNYDVDAIHFDDYFYPYTIEGQEIPDQQLFEKEGRGCNNIHDWRRDNINLLVKAVAEGIKRKKSHVKFGVSPLAIWRNKKQDPNGSLTNSGQTSYDNLYCDTKLWVEENWVDYIAPQMYWSTQNSYANFTNLMDWWISNKSLSHLYIGHAIYKLNETNKHSFSRDELINQINMTRNSSAINGSIYFRAEPFVKNHQNFQSSLAATVYRYPSLVPPMKWIDSIPPNAPEKLKIRSKHHHNYLKWKAPNFTSDMDSAAYYVVYRFNKGDIIDIEAANKIITVTKNTFFTDTLTVKHTAYNYVVTAVDRLHNESVNYALFKMK